MLGKFYDDDINAANLKQATKVVGNGHLVGKVAISDSFVGKNR